MIKAALAIIILILFFSPAAADDLRVSGLNETSYIYRAVKDSLNSYFRNAFRFSMGYGDFSLGLKFLAELPKYSTDRNQLLDELSANRLSTRWTDRYLEFERDNLILRGGTITESFGSGMVFRAWEDVDFDQDNRLDGFLAKYNNTIKAKALYGALPNRNQPAKSDLVYGLDAEIPFLVNMDIGFSLLSMRTLTALNRYNQQKVIAGRVNWTYDKFDGGAEIAATEMEKNSGADYEGGAVNIFSNVYLRPRYLKSLTLSAGYKYYDSFQYRNQDLRTFNYHNEPLADNQVTGVDEEGLQGSINAVLTDKLTFYVDYAEAWDSDYSKRMNALYTSMDWAVGEKQWLMEYSHIEKLDDNIDHWQKDIIPAVTLSMPLNKYAYTVKAEYKYVERVRSLEKNWHYEPSLQMDLGMGKISFSVAAESRWRKPEDITDGVYWLNGEIKAALFEHTDITLFAGKEPGGKVCRNGICRFVAPFQGVKLEAATRF